MLVATIIIFALVCGLIWVRRWVTERVLGRKGRFVTEGLRREMSEREDVELVQQAPK